MLISGLEEIIMEKSVFNIYKRKDGSVLITTAILLPLFMMLIGMVTDIGNALVCKAELNKACMVAAEEATKQIDMEIAQYEGLNVLGENFGQTISTFFYDNITYKPSLVVEGLNYHVIGEEENPKYIEVYCIAQVKCFFLKFIGIQNITVHSNALGRLRSLKNL